MDQALEAVDSRRVGPGQRPSRRHRGRCEEPAWEPCKLGHGRQPEQVAGVPLAGSRRAGLG